MAERVLNRVLSGFWDEQVGLTVVKDALYDEWFYDECFFLVL